MHEGAIVAESELERPHAVEIYVNYKNRLLINWKMKWMKQGSLQKMNLSWNADV